MNMTRGIALTGAALMASTMIAQAADLNRGYGGRGSIKDDHSYVSAPTGCPTTYVRIDGGYSSFDRPAFSQVGIDDHVNSRIEGSGSIGGGIGRYFTCNIRGEIAVDHRFKSDVSSFNPNPFAPNYGPMKWSYESTAVMANFYYDFNMRSRFTPYIGFGLGAVHNEFSRGTGTVGAGGPSPGAATTVAAGDKWSAAGAFMTGFVFNVRDRLKLDTGYRFIYMGDVSTGQTASSAGGFGGPIHADNLHAHEFRVGLRYDIR